MSVSREDIKKALGEMPVLELVELINELEEAWGVSAAAPVAVAAVAGGGEAAAEKDSFDVVLKAAGGSKLAVVKLVKELTG